jgi:nitric oxide reductase NorD protein
VGLLAAVREHFSGRRPKVQPVLDATALDFADAERVVQLYAQGLSDVPIALRASRQKEPAPATDTKTIVLPAKLAIEDSKAENYRLLRLMVAHQIHQIALGSFSTHAQFGAYANLAMLEDLYAAIEGRRIDGAIIAELPGLRSEIEWGRAQALSRRPQAKGLPEVSQGIEALFAWSLGAAPSVKLGGKLLAAVEESARVLDGVFAHEISAEDSFRAATYCYARLERFGRVHAPLPPVAYRGPMRLADAAIAIKRASRPPVLTPMLPKPDEPPDEVADTTRFRAPDLASFAPSKLAIRERVRAEDAVGAEEEEDYIVWLDVQSRRSADEQELTASETEGAYVYAEWDEGIAGYKPTWCAVRERSIAPATPQALEELLRKNRPLIRQVRKQFEALRPEHRRLFKQPEGEDIDLNAAVEMATDLASGESPSENVYIARLNNRRDIAVTFLVDLSGSAGGWVGDQRIVDIERDALLLLCEGLHQLNDRYSVVGFSSSTRKQVDMFVVKDFGEGYTTDVKLRLAGLSTHSYTRMGAAIRHAARSLDRVDAKIKLLMLLTDGKPNDFDGYSGHYALGDTRAALAETRGKGVRVFCLTIDSRAREYLPGLFGADGYTILSDVRRLPAKLPDVYRRMTTR